MQRVKSCWKFSWSFLRRNTDLGRHYALQSATGASNSQQQRCKSAHAILNLYSKPSLLHVSSISSVANIILTEQHPKWSKTPKTYGNVLWAILKAAECFINSYFYLQTRDHEFLIQCLHLLTRYQVLLQEENSTDPEVLKESLQDPQHSEVLSSLKVSDCLRIQDVLSTGQHCCHPWRVKTMKTEQTEMENVLIFNSSAADKENSIQLKTSLY